MPHVGFVIWLGALHALLALLPPKRKRALDEGHFLLAPVRLAALGLDRTVARLRAQRARRVPPAEREPAHQPGDDLAAAGGALLKRRRRVRAQSRRRRRVGRHGHRELRRVHRRVLTQHRVGVATDLLL
eukprot:6200451-Pleurochrysis_carterae.AAC.1